MKCEPSPASAPEKWAVVFSCSRGLRASDKQSGGNSPFASALLDEEVGVFAEGVRLRDALLKMERGLGPGQTAISIGLGAVPEDFCMRPKPKPIAAPQAAASAGAGSAATANDGNQNGAAVRAQVDSELLRRCCASGISRTPTSRTPQALLHETDSPP
jgi:hypothetical protein